MTINRDKLIDQVAGLAFGVAVAVLIAVGLEVYNAIDAAPDSSLLEAGFWKAVAVGSGITAIRSAASAVAGALGYTIKGVSNGN